MPRTEESNQRIREEQKRKIIIAATKVFARKGLAATKMADIAKEADISYGLLYHYFDTKELIFKATVERGTLAFSPDRGSTRAGRHSVGAHSPFDYHHSRRHETCPGRFSGNEPGFCQRFHL